MKTLKVLSLTMGLVAMNCIAAEPSQAPKPQTYQWTNRLELSIEQQRLLRLQLWLEDSDLAGEKRAKFEVEAKELSEKLGASTVRRARASELVKTVDRGITSIFNPSSDNVAFTVSVRGDEEQLGTRKASMGRLTYLPAKGTLRVENLYWTTPEMTKEK